MGVLLNPKIGQSDIEQAATRDGFGKGLLEIAQEQANIVVLTGDLAESTRVDKFAAQFPGRFIECGVAEQNMMGVAAGLALTGKTPFVTSYATFSPGRNWDQLRVSVCYSKANVKVIGCHAGLSVGPDGATHQALEDIAITRVLPNLDVVVPADSLQAQAATKAIASKEGPSYLRLTREKTPIFTSQDNNFQIGKADVLIEGTDIALIGCGPILYNGIIAAKELSAEGISVMVVNNHTIKPLDVTTIVEAAQKTGVVVTLEEHQVFGGMGSCVAECLAQNYPVPMEFIGMKDSFGQSGAPDELFHNYGLDVSSIKKVLKQALTRKLK